MNSKERVKATIECTGPDRLPYLPVVDVRRFMNERPEDVPKILELIRAARQDIVIMENNALRTLGLSPDTAPWLKTGWTCGG